MDAIHALAAEIAEGGFQWQQDGQKVLTIVGLAGDTFPQVVNDDLEPFLVNLLKALDREHGWDLAGRTQLQEDQLYGMFASLYVNHRNVG